MVNGTPRQFDPWSFLVLPENELAVAAVQKLAPGRRRPLSKLVTVVAPAGCGKSHLARDLFRSWDGKSDTGKRILVTATEFAADLAEAAAASVVPQFQTRYRQDVSLLVCEDLQALVSRREAQRQLVAAIDDILEGEGRVLITSTQMPAAIPGLERRLANRLQGGILVNAELPGIDSRRRLIEHFLEVESLRLSGADIELIAESCDASPRVLVGFLRQLQSELNARSRNRVNRGVLIRSLLNERSRSRELSLAVLARATAEEFGVDVAEMKGPRRSRNIARARQMAMYLARNLAGKNYAEIGVFFDRGNHSTVIHACRKVDELLKSDSSLPVHYRRILEALEKEG